MNRIKANRNGNINVIPPRGTPACNKKESKACTHKKDAQITPASSTLQASAVELVVPGFRQCHFCLIVVAITIVVDVVGYVVNAAAVTQGFGPHQVRPSAVPHKDP